MKNINSSKKASIICYGISVIISIKKGYLFWFYSIFVGFWGILIPFLLTNTFYMLDLFLAFFPALIGLIIGLIIRFIIKKYEIK